MPILPEEKDKIDLVAKKARETFLAIRKLRKTSPQFTRAQKDTLKEEITKLGEQWWEDAKRYIVRPNPGSIRACGATVEECDVCLGCGTVEKGHRFPSQH